jgi:hypothetical protein
MGVVRAGHDARPRARDALETAEHPARAAGAPEEAEVVPVQHDGVEGPERAVGLDEVEHARVAHASALADLDGQGRVVDGHDQVAALLEVV